MFVFFNQGDIKRISWNASNKLCHRCYSNIKKKENSLHSIRILEIFVRKINRSPMRKKLVIFDLDGTLVDSFKDVFNAVNSSLSEFNLPPKDREWVRLLIGPNANQLIEEAVAGSTVSVEGLNKKGVKMAVLTNKSEASSIKIPSEIKILDSFIKVVGYDTYTEAKPSPLGFHNLCEVADCLPSEAILIGDTEVDIATSKAANSHVIAVTHGYRTYNELKRELPDYIVSSPNELKHLLETLI